MVWWFSVPKVAFGEDALSELEQLAGERAFIVTDRVIADLGYAKRVGDLLESNGWKVSVWDSAEPDPRVSTVVEVSAKMENFAPDTIIAIGGGSVMDTAKAAWVVYANPATNLESLTPFDILNLRNKAKMVAIPTTAGTGSESTRAIVVREDESGRKFATINPELTADLAILEPEFVQGLPRDLTVYTGMDALTHAVEAYVSAWKNDYSDACATQAIKMIFEWLPKTVEDLEDLGAREKMLIASDLAGMAFSNSQVCLAHSLGHSLGSVLRLQHGMAVGMALPYTIEYNCLGSESAAEYYQELGEQVEILEEKPLDAARAFANKIRNFQKGLDFPTSLEEAGVKRKDFDNALEKLVEFAMMDSSITMNPRNIDSQGIEHIYTDMFEGNPVDF
jgi:alcohol dehydrogenase class IV